MTKSKRRKPHPSPPRWMLLKDLDDNCYGCKNKNACGSCDRIKQEIKEKDIRSAHDQRQENKN